MAVVISTEIFKQAVNRASKGASFNKARPLSCLVGITKSGNNLTLTTTDAVNVLCVRVPAEGDDFDVTVELDLFSKLISKLTSSEIMLEVSGNKLIVRSNGEYTLPISTDESGIVKFALPDFDYEGATEFEIDLNSILKIYRNNEMALARTFEMPCLMGYYLGDSAVTSNSRVITFTDVKFADSPILMNARTMMLLSNFVDSKIKCYRKDNMLAFDTDTMSLIGTDLAGIDEFPIDAISAYKEMAFEHSCAISKDLLLSALDRLTLFVEAFDSNGAFFEFGANELTLTNRKASSTETLSCESDGEFRCFVDIPLTKGVLSTIAEDTITIKYGLPNAIGILANDTLHIVSLLEVTE